jgi:hypothetical protein
MQPQLRHEVLLRQVSAQPLEASASDRRLPVLQEKL